MLIKVDTIDNVVDCVNKIKVVLRVFRILN